MNLDRQSRRALRISWMLDKPEALGLALAYALNGFFGLFLPQLTTGVYPWPLSTLLLVAGTLTIYGIVGLRQRAEMWGLTLMGLTLFPILVVYVARGEPIGRILVVTAIVGGLLVRAIRTWHLRRKARA